MRSVFVKLTAGLAAACALLALPACTQKEEEPSSGPYIYTPGGQSEPNAEAQTGEAVEISVNKEWQQNFTLQYTYFDKSQSDETVTIRETRTSDAFCAEYADRGDILYYKENGKDIDYYVIMKDAENVHSVIRRKSISDLSSTFMKLSDVSGELPSLTNVMFMYEESVCGRPCKKFIQRAYQNGEPQETVYVWVDNVYGFAAKGESYDASDELQVAWELKSFQSGNVTDGAIRVNPAAYDFTEQ